MAAIWRLNREGHPGTRPESPRSVRRSRLPFYSLNALPRLHKKLTRCSAFLRTAGAIPIDLLSAILTINWRLTWRAPRNSSTNEFLSALSLLDRAPSCCASDATIPSRRQELPYRHLRSRCELHQQHAIVCGLRLMSSTFFFIYILCCARLLQNS